jgi:hypothetical protein
MRPVATGTSSAIGKSRLRLERGDWIAEIASAVPKINATLTTLLPSESPSAICGSPAER